MCFPIILVFLSENKTFYSKNSILYTNKYQEMKEVLPASSFELKLPICLLENRLLAFSAILCYIAGYVTSMYFICMCPFCQINRMNNNELWIISQTK